MPGILKTSLASWREAHGFGILNLISPQGEVFLVEVSGPADEAQRGFGSWVGMSEFELRQHLAKGGFPASDIDDVIQLSRDWATTTTGSPVFPAPPKSD
jgi:hypothetical protein